MSKIQGNYETAIVISMKLGQDGINEMIEKFKALIEKHGGKVDNVTEWGKRRLAYLINDETEGYYVFIDFTSDAEFIAELSRIYNITEGILRSLTIRKGE